jgi:Uncharacterized protein conserved in bacteria
MAPTVISGETDLQKLLTAAEPQLRPGRYAFCRVDDPAAIPLDEIVGLFREAEGWTVILPEETARSLSLSYGFAAAWIIFMVHSSLEAVGFTAAFSAALAREMIGCNVVAAFYHDHIFVRYEDADRAMEALKRLTRQ